MLTALKKSSALLVIAASVARLTGFLLKTSIEW